MSNAIMYYCKHALLHAFSLVVYLNWSQNNYERTVRVFLMSFMLCMYLIASAS